MNIYSKKQQWKLVLFLLAVLIGVSSLYVTNSLVKKLAIEERKKIELWAEATREIANIEPDMDFTFFLKVIQFNETIPVIVADSDGNILDHRNLNPSRTGNRDYLQRQLELMKGKNEPIEVEIFEGEYQHIYYNDSRILIMLLYYPYIQLLVILGFLLFAYYTFSVSRKAEQNKVWLGMSKETAHQLGTPTSSLIAWLELMKEKDIDPMMLNELEKDIDRLKKITARFSKIGSKPALKSTDLVEVIDNTLEYLRIRTPKMINFEKNYDRIASVTVPLNVPLFDWVLENICKNALDATGGRGNVEVTITEKERNVYIDVTDNGKGIPKGKFKTIFKPGFSTRRNGWGLGLSLSKRIVEDYHGGKIFVLNSAINEGTTIRITLNKKLN